MYWGHLPIALEPDDLGTIYSGSAVFNWNDTSGLFNGGDGLVAIFTHKGYGQIPYLSHTKEQSGITSGLKSRSQKV